MEAWNNPYAGAVGPVREVAIVAVEKPSGSVGLAIGRPTYRVVRCFAPIMEGRVLVVRVTRVESYTTQTGCQVRRVSLSDQVVERRLSRSGILELKKLRFVGCRGPNRTK